jgi:ABC-type transporter Mla subunit MlaD
MRRLAVGLAVLLATAIVAVVAAGAGSASDATGTYKIQLDNAFGLVNGADFKVAGVRAGTITSIKLPPACVDGDPTTCLAVVTVNVTQSGFGAFHADAFCQSRPQSLIGEYFLDCNPGSTGIVLPPGSTIPVTHTQSTIPADLVQDVMRLPYRQRFSLIINELGAAVASRSESLQSALRRADPALAETDNLLSLLAGDDHTIQQLNVSANSVITALANNSKQVQRFIVEANNTATDSATQASNIQATWSKLPAFLEQLRPAMAKLGAAADAQDPVFRNLNAASANLKRFFVDLAPFSRTSLPALQSLGKASAVGKPAVQAATPTIAHLNQFAKPTPELAQNLAIVLGALDNRKFAVERDPRSPDGGAGYTGLESLLQYVFNITNAINYFGPYGHMLGVDAFANTACSPYATPQTIANNLAQYQSGQSPVNPRSCYAFLGPNQQGVNEADPTFNAKDATPANPSACVPDPGGAPVMGYGTSYAGPATSACKLQASNPLSGLQAHSAKPKSKRRAGVKAAPGTNTASAGGGGGSRNSGSAGSGGNPAGSTVNKVQQTVGQIISGVTDTVGGALPNTGAGQASGASTPPPANQAQQLLNYLLAP